jgi:hypothetical protein
MAQTKQNARKSSGGARKSSSGTKSSGGARSSARSKPSGGRAKSAAASKRTPTATKRSGNGSAPKSRSGGSATSRRRSSSSSSNGPVANARETVVGGAQSAANTVAGGAQSAGRAVGSAANAAKVPAVAGGAALAGLVGGMAIARGGRRKVLGVPVPGTRRPLVKIKAGRGKGAKQMLKTGQQVADLAIEVRQARRQLAPDRKRSPIEVVLDGLTARRPRDAAK